MIRLRPLPTLLLAAVLLSACDGGAPDPGEWEAAWDGARRIVPPIEVFDEGLDEEECEDTLVRLRRVREELFPAPDDLLGQAADRWLQHAETIFFECPSETGPHVGFEAGYAELERLEREVEGLLR